MPKKKKATTSVAHTLGQIVGAFKSTATSAYISGVKNGQFLPFDKSISQRNRYEHVIRNEKLLNKIREFVAFNPQK